MPKNENKLFQRSEHDVLSRYYQAAKKFRAKNIVRITSDCPLLDPRVVDDLIQKFKSKKQLVMHQT